jgi:DNA polymerase III subunit beta
MQIERDYLLSAISAVRGAIQRKTTIPILNHARLVSDGDTLSVTGTDMDMQITFKLSGVKSDPFDVAIPANTLYDALRKIPSGEIKLTIKDDKATLQCGRSRFRLPVMAGDDMPVIKSECGEVLAIGAGDLSYLFGRGKFAMSNDEVRYYLCGTYLDVKDGAVNAVATDGHRAACTSFQTVANIPSVIVPRKAVTEILRVIDGTDAPATVTVSDVSITVECRETVITSKLIDGTFPDYERVIPDAGTTPVISDRKALVDAVSRVASVLDGTSNAVKLEIAGDTMTVTASHPTDGDAEDSVDIQYEGEPITIGFNHKYLTEMLANLTDDMAVIHLTGDLNPALIIDDNSRFVLMPMRVK